MAAYNKFEVFADTDLPNKVHDVLGTTVGTDVDDIKIYLSNTAPSASADNVKADLAEIATGNGYTGPVSVTPSGTGASGTFTLQGTKVTITASGGAISQFRYVVLFNDTPTSPADPLIAWWDHGSAVDLADGESFEIRFNSVDGTGDIFTIA